MIRDKTVYVLGAGFSYPHAPCQEKILEEIFNYDSSNSWNSNKQKFEESRKIIKIFLEELFQTKEEGLNKINLEDILTILDKAILLNENIRKRDNYKLKKLKSDLIFCIAYVFDEKLKGEIPPFYKALSHKLVEKRSNSKLSEDKFSIVSLNWDLLLDDAINNETIKYNKANYKDVDSSQISVSLDYCTYTNNFDEEDGDNPDTVKKALGYRNIKLLKLHGSFNWLLCKNCNRLLKKFDKKIVLKASEYLKETCCIYCEQKNLSPVIITPTILKDLNNVHLKTIWHNAEIELMEADRIVFVGYSLPLADFEFRYLLKRCISKEATVEIVIKYRDKEKDKDTLNRYLTFFGDQVKEQEKFRLTAEQFFKSEFGFT